MKKTTIGGQALLEGLLMIGPEYRATAIRKPDGEIIVEKHPQKPKGKLSKIPIVRGAVNLFSQMVIGVKALMYSAEFIDLEEDDKSNEPSKIEQFLERKFGDKITDIAIYFSVVLSIFLSVGLFILLPNLIAGFIPVEGVVFKNLIEGALRVGIFIGYLALVSLLKDMKRVWEYHGAEHKTIHCYEHGDELTVENVRKYTTKHPRCGTSLFFTIMIISILIFSFTGWHNIFLNAAIRILLVPVVAGVSLELIKFAVRHENWVFKIFSAPGLMFQKFTTREPDDSQIEVAIAAFNEVIPNSEIVDDWGKD
ncbi:protein of unknown function DUF1385 [Ruminiclostridium papyrosolvens DSM 2782]|uniref:Metal-dependent enzyme n=1 Tax=Ruminiclostridium papyrosolvens DSM 2782 TaxID=588581 RepID=F1TB27_9FIRM|nr:DUF1385 domain-containing protein [Ruminiclostridium papyrosolvens]EGD48231.1 protein of unknown function DUF1385 [Ruminiclostridium papyrosolvens DSM 2782]WES34259.1 DUF1385 domain-containing protein [Ruminiclostridium papyrosolvens DSM 2782]